MEVKALEGLTVLDAGVGMAAALAAKFLSEQGARLLRAEPPGSDPFYAVYPAYAEWRLAEARVGADVFQSLLSTADICIIGGEDHPASRVPAPTAEDIAANARLIVLDIGGYPPGLPSAGPAVDILVQARAGLTWAQFDDRPNVMAFHPASYGACLNGLIGVMAALYDREQTGRGQRVSTSLFEGALTYSTSWNREAERPDATFNAQGGTATPYRCRDGAYIKIVMASAGAKAAAEKVLFGGESRTGAGAGTAGSARTDFSGNVEAIKAKVAEWDSRELLEALRNEGAFAGPVLPPGACWDDPQVRHNGTICTTEGGLRRVGPPIALRTTNPGPARPRRSAGAPLAGLKVVDFGTFVAGPLGAVPLADLGAEVIKVEQLAGDPVRPITGAFAASNRGKRAIAVDMKSPRGAEIVHRLCREADVVMSNFRPGVGARLGIDAAAVHNANASAVVLESTAYGAKGPDAQRGGFDGLFQAVSGLEFRGGGEGNLPLYNKAAIVDWTTGALGAVATVMGLYYRARTGGGSTLEASLLDSSLFLMSELLQRPDGTFEGVRLLNSAQTGFDPAECLYQAADGWLAIAVRDEHQAQSLDAALDLDGTLARSPASWAEAEATAIADGIRKLPVAEALRRLRACGVWSEACVQPRHVATQQEPGLFESGTLVRDRDPRFGNVVEVGTLFRLSRSQRRPRALPPTLGQDTRSILTECGYGLVEVDELIRDRVIA